MNLKKSDSFKFTISWDEDIEFKKRIIKWSTVAFKIWCEQSDNKRACKKLLKSNTTIKINKRWKSFWGSITQETYIASEFFDFLAEYDKDMQKLDDLSFYFIISHEIGHCIDYAVRGESWHDQHWKEICSIIGAQPSTTIEVKNINKIKRLFPDAYKKAKEIVKNNSVDF